MVQQSQKDKLETLVRGTVLSLCQNVLEHKTEIKVDIFVGVTIDQAENFHFSIVETLHDELRDAVSDNSPNRPKRAKKITRPDALAEVDEVESDPDALGDISWRNSSQPFVEIEKDEDYDPKHDSSYAKSKKARGRSSFGKSTETLAALLKAGPRNKVPDVTSLNQSSAEASQQQSDSWSYSNLLRSLGEMSRQHKDPVPPSRPTPYSDPMPASQRAPPPPQPPPPVNSAQVVIPINFAIHSPSTSQPSVSASSSVPPHVQQPRWSYDAPPPPKPSDYTNTGVSCYPSASTTSTPKGKTQPYDVKVKQEVISDEEGEMKQEYPVPDTTTEGPQTSELSQSPTPDGKRKGILLSLLSEEGKFLKYRKGVTRQPAYPSQVAPPVPEPMPSVPEFPRPYSWVESPNVPQTSSPVPQPKKTTPKPRKTPQPRAARDPSIKARRVILLNCGPYASIRMVHRSLQGMRSGQIMDVMMGLNRERSDPDYVGEFKIVPLNKVKQGRREAGIFYKCPPEEIKPEALLKNNVDMHEYTMMYYQTYRYDRWPQPEYFHAVSEHAPFKTLYISSYPSSRPGSDPTEAEATSSQAQEPDSISFEQMVAKIKEEQVADDSYGSPTRHIADDRYDPPGQTEESAADTMTGADGGGGSEHAHTGWGQYEAANQMDEQFESTNQSMEENYESASHSVDDHDVGASNMMEGFEPTSQNLNESDAPSYSKNGFSEEVRHEHLGSSNNVNKEREQFEDYETANHNMEERYNVTSQLIQRELHKMPSLSPDSPPNPDGHYMYNPDDGQGNGEESHFEAAPVVSSAGMPVFPEPMIVKDP